jgi:glutathione S-transferase
MLTIYGCYRSRATRPLWLLAEMGTPFTHVPVIQAYRLNQPKAPDAPLNTVSGEFLAINPMGQIPAMVDGDLVLSESFAITMYLARRYGGALGPASDAEGALMEQWSLFAISAIEGPALDIRMVLDKGLQTPDAEAFISVSAEKLRRPFAHLARRLEGHDWLVGDRFTVADLNVAECVRYGAAHPTLMDEYPAVKAWLARAHARPAFQAMWAAREAEPV